MTMPDGPPQPIVASPESNVAKGRTMSRSTFAIADLHGRHDLLTAALDKIRQRAPDGGTVVFMGDYIDRGPDSRAVLETLMAGAPDGWRWICLKGNHEAMMVETVETDIDPSWWLDNGGDATLASFRAPYPAAIPPDVIDWCRALPAVHADGRRIFVHAGIDPTLPVAQQSEAILLWRRLPKSLDVHHPEGHVVHGHTPFEDGPICLSGRTNLDTGAVFTGRLVIARFDDDLPGGPVERIEVTGPAG